ncbi:efflux RND transporter periplasmic adaptor subunit [Microbulbifer rhizosphaerae]|uniref:RND family efflux transporter MFP subunit n=1 Tax=Microbulbifer rhizosphaerae TaxID=1562603 RepID=A0A7W4Z871_9GAMM|nr:efflux RND transporter periplasmic adaptor subunit [Microbulbifer rhizosphaerae]MBB3060282.1 RND family efflux transporter MFP subunit [Microbulbifer rhizosphaerae]
MSDCRARYSHFPPAWPGVFALASIIFLLVACSRSAEETAVAPPLRVVDTALVQNVGAERVVTLSGRVRAAEQSALSFEVNGEIENLSVDVGDPVEVGQVLAQLDDTRYQLAHALTVSNEAEALATFHERKLDYERQRKLIDRGVVSQARLDSAKAAMDTARSRYESARVSRRMAERDLRLTKLKSPFAGSISRRYVEPSERVNSNQVILEVISDRQGFEIETSVPENLIGELDVQVLQSIALPAVGVANIPARVRHIGTQPESSNNYPVVLLVEQSVGGIRSGMTAEVRLTFADRSAANAVRAGQLAVPLTALVYGAGESAHVLRVSKEGQLERIEVRVVSLGEQSATVSGELSAGDRVVARGVEFVSAGDLVAVLGQGPERFN